MGKLPAGRQGYYTHDLTAAVTAYTRPAHNQASQNPSMYLGRAFDILKQSQELLPAMVAERGRVSFFRDSIQEKFVMFQFDSPTPCTHASLSGFRGLQR